MTKGTKDDIRNLLMNISMSTGLSNEQLEDCVDYLYLPIEEILKEKIKVIGDNEFTLVGTPQEFIDFCFK